MSTTSIEKDLDALTMTVTARFDASVERIWQLWSDPRQLERWWGPPTYPATVTEHELAPGGMVRYFMTGPEGDRHAGWWRVTGVEAPHRLAFEDGFADADGMPSETLPVTQITVTLSESAGETTMAIASRFPSREAMEQLLAMGMEEGIAQAVGQIDTLLAEVLA